MLNALDVETKFEGPAHIYCGATSADGFNSIVYTRDALRRRIKDGEPFAFQNGIFDATQVFEDFGVWPIIQEDTLLQSYSLDERGGKDEDEKGRGVGIHGLKRMAGEYCGAQDYNINLREAIAKGEWDRIYEYNARDAAYTRQLVDIYREAQIKDGVREMYLKLLIPTANVLARSLHDGAYIDRAATELLGLRWGLAQERLLNELQGMAKGLGFSGDLNPGSWQQVGKIIYDLLGMRQVNGRKTDVDTLELLPKHPFIDKLLLYRRYTKFLSTYVFGILDDVDENGFIHAQALLNGTVTGRLAYKNPPVMVIPAEHSVGAEFGVIRNIFAASGPDRLFVQADYEQAELYAAWMNSKDPVLWDDLSSGDYHSRAAEGMFNKRKSETAPQEWAAIRHDSKFVTFGILFGRLGPSLHKAELSHYSRAECNAFVARWFERYRVHKQWMDGQRREATETGEQVAPSGRKRRHLIVRDNHQLNQAVNFPVQCTSHDNLLLSWHELYSELDGYDTRILFENHDSLLFDIPKAAAPDILPIIKEVMQRDRFGCGIPVEIKVGPNWGQVQKIA